jgi:hypothetical protein
MNMCNTIVFTRKDVKRKDAQGRTGPGKGPAELSFAGDL